MGRVHHEPKLIVLTLLWNMSSCAILGCMTDNQTAESAEVRVGFRYQDGEVLTPAREALSEDDEIPTVVIDLGDGEWLTLAELRDLHSEGGDS